MAPHSSTLAWKVPWIEERGGLQSMGSQRVGHNRVTNTYLLTLLYWLLQILWLCGSPQTGKFFNRWEYQTTWLASWEICMQVRKQQLELDMEQDWFQIGKGVHQDCIVLPWLFTYIQSTSWEMLGWMKHKLESRLPGEISITSDMQIIPPLWQKVKKN